MQKDLMPDPLNDHYATDKEGRLYVHTVVDSGGVLIDIGYSIVGS